MVFTLSNLLLFLTEVIIGIQSVFFKPDYTAQFFGYSFIHFGILYGTFMFIALVVIIKNNKKLKFNEATVLASIVTYPWFWMFVLSGFIDGLLHKDKRVTWATTEHSGQVTTKIKK